MFYSGKFIGDERNAQDIKLAALAVVAISYFILQVCFSIRLIWR